MTRDQQHTTKALDVAMTDWLRSYGWAPDGPGRWRHAKLADSLSYTTHDAYEQTRGNKRLGWP